MKIKEKWVSWEEFDLLFPGMGPTSTVDFGRVGGLTPGSIPFADAAGMLAEYNTAFFFDEANVRLGVGTGGPVCTGHFRKAACADYAGVQANTVLLLENAGNVILHLQGGTAATAYIDFCDDNFNPPAGRVAYDFANDWLEFGVGGNEILQLKAGPTFDYAGTLTLDGIVAIGGTSLRLENNAEIRFYDNGNYVGFEAPALTANQIWVLPDEDGDNLDFLQTDGGGNLTWAPGGGGAGDVTAAAVLADHTLIRGDGGAKGIQDSGIDIDDADNITFPDGASINLQEDITFLGATTENLIKFPDNLPDALSFMEAGNPYQTFITTNGSEAIQFHEDVLLKGSTEYGATNKTTGAWAKSIGGGGDYADWATMIADMPDLIAHAVTVTIETGTTLTEICDLKNKHGVASAAQITIQAEKFYPVAPHGQIPTADSATATTLRDAALAAEAYGNDYFNGCWVFIVHGTGTDNGFVVITDYVDVTGDVVVANWPGTRPDNTSRYIIVGALVDGEAARNYDFQVYDNTVSVLLHGIGLTGAAYGLRVERNFGVITYCIGTYQCEYGLHCSQTLYLYSMASGWIDSTQMGISATATNYLLITFSAFSDNATYGVQVRSGTFGFSEGNFGDNNGNWGTYCQYSGGMRFKPGVECSGAIGNHSDPGTAGNASADQAVAY